MQILDNVSVPDTYSDTAAAIEYLLHSNGGYFTVGTNPVYMQLGWNIQGQIHWTREVPVPIGTGTIFPGTAGIRFRNYVAGQIAKVSAAISENQEPSVNLGAGGIASSGSVVAALTGDYKVSAIAASHADPNGGQWLLCDGTAISGTFATLIALVGANTPDARGRVLTMLGTNAAVNAIGKNDGVAIANRRPQHRHTPHIHGVSVGNVDGTPVSCVTWNNNLQSTFNSNSADGGSGVGTDSLDAPAFIVPGNLFIHT